MTPWQTWPWERPVCWSRWSPIPWPNESPRRSRRWARGSIALAAGAAVATTVADRVVRRRKARGERHGQAEAVARYGGPTAIAAGTLALTTATLTATRPKKVWNSPRRTRDLGTGAAAAIATIAAWDFIYYWNHRLMHTPDCCGRTTSRTTARSASTCRPPCASRWPTCSASTSRTACSAWPASGPRSIEQARGVNLLYQFWIHTDLIPKLGKAEEALNTASHHRVHHGSNIRYIDRNHGSILIVWDRLFGTFSREDDAEPVIYGLTKNIHSDNPAVIASHEFRDIVRDVADSDNWSDRISFVARGPGWAYARRAELDASPFERDREPATAGVA